MRCMTDRAKQETNSFSFIVCSYILGSPSGLAHSSSSIGTSGLAFGMRMNVRRKCINPHIHAQPSATQSSHLLRRHPPILLHRHMLIRRQRIDMTVRKLDPNRISGRNGRQARRRRARKGLDERELGRDRPALGDGFLLRPGRGGSAGRQASRGGVGDSLLQLLGRRVRIQRYLRGGC